MRAAVLFACSAALALTASCDIASLTEEAKVGCDFRDGSANGPEPRCQSRDGIDAGTFAAACEALQGEVIDGGCDTTGALGGCDISGGNTLTTVIDWYYPPLTVAEAEQECADEGGAWAPL